MSARPRPITATFPPPPLLSPVHLRPSSRSPSPLNSTASLLSVLNHISYESVPSQIVRGDEEDHSYDIEDSSYGLYKDRDENSNGNVTQDSSAQVAGSKEKFWARNLEKNLAKENAVDTSRITGKTKISAKEHKESKLANVPKQSVRISSAKHSSENNLQETDAGEVSECSEKDTKESRNELSAWERWIVQKAKEERAKAEQELDKQRKLSEEEKRVRQEKDEKKKKTQEVIREWIKDYDLRKKTENETQMHKTEEEEAQKQREKQVTSGKAKAKYDEWVHKKAEEEAKRKKEMAEKEEKELLEKQDRQKKSDEAFNEWCKKAQSRPRTAPSSYGYTDGKLRGYYDSGAYPIPSYVNPVPWRPIEIPKVKPQPKKKKKKNRSQLIISKYL